MKNPKNAQCKKVQIPKENIKNWKEPMLTIVNIIVNKNNFKNDSFFKKQLYKKRSQIVFTKRSFFPKTKRTFLKTIEKRNQNDRFQ